MRLMYVCTLLTILPLLSWADALLFVAPTRVIVKDGQKTQVVSATNKSERIRKYKLSLIDQVMTENGTTEAVDTFPYSAKRMIRFIPREITLQPGQRQLIRLLVRRPNTLEDGDYHTHLLFDEEVVTQETTDTDEANNNQFQIDMNTTFGLAVPVIIQQGNIDATLLLTGANLSIHEQGGVEVLLNLARTGNSEATGHLTVTTQNDNGETEKIATDRKVRIYREVDDVTLTHRLTKTFEELAGKTIQISLKTGPSQDSTDLGSVELQIPEQK